MRSMQKAPERMGTVELQLGNKRQITANHKNTSTIHQQQQIAWMQVPGTLYLIRKLMEAF